LCQGQFRLFFKQISANFAKDANQICVAAAGFMAKVGVTSMFGAFYALPQKSPFNLTNRVLKVNCNLIP
jgi:hypothetical protein